MDKEKLFSCSDCGVYACKGNGAVFPKDCLTRQTQEKLLPEMRKTAGDPAVRRLIVASAETEATGYGRWCRIEDTIAFARRIGAKKLGVASCIGLIREARQLAKVLQTHGFTVHTACCKIGAVPKEDLGIPEYCTSCGKNSCNPILQASYLNERKTDLNIVFGLCVGHDSLFYRYSDALCTTLVAKDRVTGHHPVMPLYLTETYYKRLLVQSDVDDIQPLEE